MANRSPTGKGVWNVLCVHVPGIAQIGPSAHSFLRAAGERAMFGWPDDPRLETMRDAWFSSTAPAEQRAIGVAMQGEAFSEVPYVPPGAFCQPTAHRKELSDMLKGLPLFWDVRRG